MFLTNGIPAVLIKNNRNESDYYDDQDKISENIVVCPYNVDQVVKFGMYTVPEATGFCGRTYSILKVKDNWVWNKIANFTVAVK